MHKVMHFGSHNRQFTYVWSMHGLMQLAQAEGLKVARQQLGRCNVAASSVAAKVLLDYRRA